MEIRRAREKKRNLKVLILREIAVIAYTTEKKNIQIQTIHSTQPNHLTTEHPITNHPTRPPSTTQPNSR